MPNEIEELRRQIQAIKDIAESAIEAAAKATMSQEATDELVHALIACYPDATALAACFERMAGPHLDRNSFRPGSSAKALAKAREKYREWIQKAAAQPPSKNGGDTGWNLQRADASHA